MVMQPRIMSVCWASAMIMMLLVVCHQLVGVPIATVVVQGATSHAVTGPEDVVPMEYKEEHRRSKRSLGADTKQHILDIHNDLRAEQGAAGMKRMIWNDKLAEMAQVWAEGCQFIHGQAKGMNSSWRHTGQSILAIDHEEFNVDAAFQSWKDQKNYYDLESNSCTKACGEFTQMVWDKSFEVGCYVESCDNLRNDEGRSWGPKDFFICNYGPAGNFNGEKPYTVGPACTDCPDGHFACKGGLCNLATIRSCPECTCEASCYNNGTVTQGCMCECPDGWAGSRCADHCGDSASCQEKTTAECDLLTHCPVLCCQCVPSGGIISEDCQKRTAQNSTTTTTTLAPITAPFFDLASSISTVSDLDTGLYNNETPEGLNEYLETHANANETSTSDSSTVSVLETGTSAADDTHASSTATQTTVKRLTFTLVPLVYTTPHENKTSTSSKPLTNTSNATNSSVITTETVNASLTSTKTINASAITTAKAATTTKAYNASVTATTATNGSATTTPVANASVTSTKSSNASATTALPSNASVTTTKPSNASVTTTKPSNASVTTKPINASETNTFTPVTVSVTSLNMTLANQTTTTTKSETNSSAVNTTAAPVTLTSPPNGTTTTSALAAPALAKDPGQVNLDSDVTYEPVTLSPLDSKSTKTSTKHGDSVTPTSSKTGQTTNSKIQQDMGHDVGNEAMLSSTVRVSLPTYSLLMMSLFVQVFCLTQY